MIALLFLLAPLALVAPLSAQVTPLPTWTQQAPATSPSARYYATMAYDAATGKVVLFGGSDGSNLSDTWTWDGSNWTEQVPATSPSSREWAAMAYDAATGKVVLFGGYDGSHLSDTWTWDGSNWTQQNPATSPPARLGAMMAYDSEHAEIVLYGGLDNNNSRLGDTWTWDGSNWTQQSPATSPSARDFAAMAYDAASNQTVLFGGLTNDGYADDTWTWDGSNWTQQSPSTSPGWRYALTMAYDAATGQVVLFGGLDSSGVLGDTWTWDGSNWTQQSSAVSPAARDYPGMAYDASSGQVVLFGGGAAGTTLFGDTWNLSSGNMGTANVCPTGVTSPAPCSQTETLTFGVGSTITVGSVNVLTQGAPNLDFTQTATTCTGTLTAPTTCTVTVQFAPTVPGARNGAVVLQDSSGNVLATNYIYGTGVGPQIAFGPGSQSTIYSALDVAGLAVDPTDNLYFANTLTNQVFKLPSNGSGYGTPVALGSGYINPMTLAIDGAGNVYVVDEGNDRIVKVPWNGNGYGTQTTVPTNGLLDPYGVTVDGLGNIYIADMANSRVVEVPWTGNGYGAQMTLPFSGLANPESVALDARGDVLAADTGNSRIVELPRVGDGYGSQIIVENSVVPSGIAVDANGDVFTSYANGGRVVEIPWTGSAYGTEVTLATGLADSNSLALDNYGNIFVTTDTGSSGSAIEITQGTPPSLSFPATSAGSVSSPQAGTVSNIGNASLLFPLPSTGSNPSVSANFVWDDSSTCEQTTANSSGAYTLAAGSSCTLAVDFAPATTGYITGSEVLTDNTLNAASAMQSINLNGTGNAGVPGAPTSVTATAGNGQATVSFTAPASNGGSPITRYTVTSSPGNFTGSGTSSPMVVAGLTNGTSYTFTVTATNTIGTGPVSAASNAVTPATVPGAPTNVTAIAGNGQATVTFTAPASNGGEPITSYTVTSSPGNLTVTTPVTAVVLVGLTNGTAYTFTATATNALGVGPASAASNAVTPATVPGAPTNVTATAGNGQATISFTAPASNGGTPITGYTVTSSPGGLTATGTSSPMVVAGLTNGLAYTFTVTATNAVGTGPQSAPSNAVTPQSPQSPQTITFNNPGTQYLGTSPTLTATASSGLAVTFSSTTTGVCTITSGGTLALVSAGTCTIDADQAGDAAFLPAPTVAQSFSVAPSVPVNIGTANVCPSGAASPSPCSQATTLSFSVAAGTTIGSVNILTQGATKDAQGNPLDFQSTPNDTSTTLCAAQTYSSQSTCTVDVTFTPRYAGQRTGAVVVADGSNHPIATAYLYGTGQAPQLVFPSNKTAQTLGGGFNSPLGIAVDGAGNVYAADSNNNAVKETPSGCSSSSCVTTLGGGFSFPLAVAVDGSGNIYVADEGNREVKEMSPGCASSSCVTTLGAGFSEPFAVAVDASGNVYVADEGNGNPGGGIVDEMTPGCASAACVTAMGGGFYIPEGVAVDGSGNVYVGDTFNESVEEMPPGCGSSSCVTTLGGGFNKPQNLAVDASGNVYVADAGNGVVKEMPAGCASVACVTTLGGSFDVPAGVAVDGSGNVYVADVSQSHSVVTELNFATPPSLSFATTSVGSTSSDSPQTVVVKNIGNQQLNLSGLTVANNWTQVSSGGTDCSPTSQVAAGGWCNLAISFTPQIAGNPLTGSVLLTDNTLNQTNATQTISLSGSVNAVPGAPTNVTATAGNGQATITWTPPASNGGSAITSYTVISSQGNEIITVMPMTSVTLTGLTNGTSYTFTVTATNAVGTGPASAASNVVTPATVPAAPANVSATAGNGQAAITWTPPASNGGEAITSYTVTSNPGNFTVSTADTSATLAGLTNGVTYTFTVTATNALGIGPASTSNAVTPATVPGAPTNVTATAGNGQATITWTPPASNGGSAITSYTVISSQGNEIITVMPTTSVTLTGLTNGVTYTFVVTATNALGIGPASAPSNAVTPQSPQINPPVALQFVPVTPCRVVDTRNATGPFGGPQLAGGSTRTFDIPQSACNIPSTAVTYSLNVTVVPSGSLGYLTIWPAGQARPLVSTLNSDGRIKANAAIVPAGTNGGVSVYVTNSTQLVLDIDGYFVPAGTNTSGLEFYPVTPCRIADTRNATGPLGGPTMSGGTSRAFPVQSSSCGIPATAQAYSLNVTAVPHGTLGYLTAWPTGETQPLVSTLNSPKGEVVANAAIVPAGSGGDISIYVNSPSDVVLDINGYFAPPGTGGLSLYTVSPCRVIDTRNGSGAFSGTLTVNVTGSACAPPSTAQAYVFNATVVPSGELGYLTLWPNGETQPLVSTLNSPDGAITSNMAIVPTINGSINAYPLQPTNLILDISSYFAP